MPSRRNSSVKLERIPPRAIAGAALPNRNLLVPFNLPLEVSARVRSPTLSLQRAQFGRKR
jgi:hypothetical protein